MRVARQFAERVAEQVGPDEVDQIDARNLFEENRSVCHSHDFCDANVFMLESIMDVTGVDAAATSPMPEPVDQLWQAAWDTTKRIGFRRLSMVRGNPDAPAEEMKILHNKPRSMKVTLPGMDFEAVHPLEVHLDFWGRNPHLQVLCYNHADEEGEPKVCVRYSQDGKVVEVLAGNITLIKGVDGDFTVRPYAVTEDTPWEIERDANPACIAGDKLQMPSGQVATVMPLQGRYEGDIGQFRTYDALYGIVGRLDGYPASNPRHMVYDSVDQACDVNPLTAGTTNPDDFSFVPTQPANQPDAT